MSRHQDWDPLWSGDPLPGEPATVDRWAARYARTADEIRDQASALKRLSQAEGWDSDAGRAFAAKAAGVQGKLALAEDRYRVAGSALSGYADRLESLQAQADRLLDRARHEQAVMRANEPVSRTPFSTPATAQEAALQASVVSEDNARAHRYAEAASRLQELTRQVMALRHQRDEAAHAAGLRIRAVIEHDGLKDSRWDKVKHWVHEHKDILIAIKSALGKIAIVLAVAALLVTGVGWIALAGIAVSLLSAGLGTLLKASGEGGSWWEVALDLFGAFAAFKLLKMVPAAKDAATTARAATATAKGNAARRGARAANRQYREGLNRLAQSHEGTPLATAARARIRDLKAANDRAFAIARDDVLNADTKARLLRLVTGDTELAQAARSYYDLSRIVRAGGGDPAAVAALARLRARILAASGLALPANASTVNNIVSPVRERLSR